MSGYLRTHLSSENSPLPRQGPTDTADLGIGSDSSVPPLRRRPAPAHLRWPHRHSECHSSRTARGRSNSSLSQATCFADSRVEFAAGGRVLHRGRLARAQAVPDAATRPQPGERADNPPLCVCSRSLHPLHSLPVLRARITPAGTVETSVAFLRSRNQSTPFRPPHCHRSRAFELSQKSDLPVVLEPEQLPASRHKIAVRRKGLSI